MSSIVSLSLTTGQAQQPWYKVYIFVFTHVILPDAFKHLRKWFYDKSVKSFKDE